MLSRLRRDTVRCRVVLEDRDFRAYYIGVPVIDREALRRACLVRTSRRFRKRLPYQWEQQALDLPQDVSVHVKRLDGASPNRVSSFRKFVSVTHPARASKPPHLTILGRLLIRYPMPEQCAWGWAAQEETHDPKPRRTRGFVRRARLVYGPPCLKEIAVQVPCGDTYHTVKLRPDGRFVLCDHPLGTNDPVWALSAMDPSYPCCFRVLADWREAIRGSPDGLKQGPLPAELHDYVRYLQERRKRKKDASPVPPPRHWLGNVVHLPK